MSFIPVTRETLSALSRHLSENQKRMADFTVGYQYMWAEEYATAFGTLSGEPFLSATDGGVRVYAPLSVLSEDKLREVTEELLEKEGEAHLVCLTPSEAEAFLRCFPDGTVSKDRAASDYLYDTNCLAAMTGKKYAKKRNHVAAFLRENGAPALVPLREDTLPLAERFLREFRASREDDSPSAHAEGRAAERLLPLVEEGMLDGHLLSVGGAVLGFAITERRGDTVYIHVEKALREVRGAYPYLAREVARMAGTRLVNREEDDGDEGLRKSKLSYLPREILHKYRADLSLKGRTL